MLNIVFFTHPTFLGSQSMPRFARMLSKGMAKRGHHVEVLSPKPKLYKLPLPGFFKKWLGYFDQYILFPIEVRRHLKFSSKKSLFVFVDQALGPWVPMVRKYAHVIHCHDFLAQRSALGEIPENPTGWTGKIYQKYIRKGYSQGKHFIAVSHKTQHDLLQFLPDSSVDLHVVYNGLNQSFIPHDLNKVRNDLYDKYSIDLSKGYILHVGGNQWYKNRGGVIEIYDAWRETTELALPLIMIGASPNKSISINYNRSRFKEDIHFLTGIDDESLKLAYAGASLFLFPSLAEGFGWPIAEAMASGCPVITTNEAPMNEVGGDAAFYIAKRPSSGEIKSWADNAATCVAHVINLSPAQKSEVIRNGLENTERFDQDVTLDKIEEIYIKIFQSDF